MPQNTASYYRAAECSCRTGFWICDRVQTAVPQGRQNCWAVPSQMNHGDLV